MRTAMRLVTAGLSLGLGAAMLAPSGVLAQSADRVSLDRLMTEEERIRTGVSHLTRSERAALEDWLSRYATADGRAAHRPRSSPLGGRIERSEARGTVLELSDGTRWDVYLPDVPSATAWREGDYLVVRRRPAAIGDYDYQLINGHERSSAAARFAGMVPSRERAR